MAHHTSDKHDFFTSMILGIEIEAQKSEQAADTACNRVNYVRLDFL